MRWWRHSRIWWRTAGSRAPADIRPPTFRWPSLEQAQLDRLLGAHRQGAIEDLYALSPLQAGLLFHTLYAPRSGAYVVQILATIAEPVAPERLIAAWRHAIARHPILRTGFAWQGLAEPVQVVHQEAQLPVEQLDWRTQSGSAQRAPDGGLAALRPGA